METIRLSNGVAVPVLGIGTFMITPADTENAVYSAIKLGYRMIDTANAYMNEEAAVNGDENAAAAQNERIYRSVIRLA
ncbi:MAG: hypothetical protein IJ874_02130 [Ruminococcus sp.]|nr:hypothetical protein [Ruminococcus sp.]